jgi:D-alanyl-D-alanine carboxypeptidase
MATLALAGCGGGSSGAPATHEPRGAPAARGRPGLDHAARRRLQATLDRVRRGQGAPGAAAAVVVPGAGVWVGVSGLADLRTRAPVRAGTLFAAGSVTKVFVAALVLKLAEDGVLGLDDRLSRWVPAFPGGGRITLRRLLNHTSGLADYVTDGRFLAAQRRRGVGARWTPQQLLRYVPEPLAKPGERWIYANTNFLLLGLAVERATGSTVGRELHRRLLPRSAFSQLVFQTEDRPRGSVAAGSYQADADPALESTPDNPYVPSTADATSAWASGNLLAGAGDLARAGDALFRGNVLGDRSRRRMTRWVEAIFQPPEYGLGLARDRLAGEEVWGHSGDITGFHADLWHVPQHGVTVAALVNAQADPDSRDRREIAEALIAEARAVTDGWRSIAG